MKSNQTTEIDSLLQVSAACWKPQADSESPATLYLSPPCAVKVVWKTLMSVSSVAGLRVVVVVGSLRYQLMTSPAWFSHGGGFAAAHHRTEINLLYVVNTHTQHKHILYIHTAHVQHTAPFGSSLTSSDTGCNVILHDTDMLTWWGCVRRRNLCISEQEAA